MDFSTEGTDVIGNSKLQNVKSLNNFKLGMNTWMR